jgi:hypothetical protein
MCLLLETLARDISLQAATVSETSDCVQKLDVHAIRDTLHLHLYSPAFNIIVQKSLVAAAVPGFYDA